MPEFVILLSSSDQTESGGNPFAPDMFDYRSSNTFNFYSELNPDRRELIDHLADALETHSPDELREILQVPDKLDIETVIEKNEDVMDSPLMSALDRFRPGPIYEAMDFPNLPTGAQRRMLENGVIFSGLFGILRPDDLIPDYFLPITASLPEVGRLTDYWRSRMSDSLNRTLEGQIVWNFLDEECEEAWNDTQTYRKLVYIDFYDDRGDERKPHPEDRDNLIGQLIGFIVEDATEEVEELNDWEHPQYFQVDEEASEWDEESKVHRVALVALGEEARPDPEEEEE